MNLEYGDKKNMPGAERQAFVRVLVAYYSGVGLIRKAFDPVEPGLMDRYYRRKKRYPDEMAEIEREAAAKARQERQIHQLAFEDGRSVRRMFSGRTPATSCSAGSMP